MKLQKYTADKDNPAVKGSLTAEEIVRTFWENNYKNTKVSLNALKRMVKAHVDEGGDVFRCAHII